MAAKILREWFATRWVLVIDFRADTQWKFNMDNGIMFAVPIPEQYHAVGEKLEEYVARAVQESEENGMAKAGSDVTPWLLNRVRELSGGVSMESNIALLKNNALIGQRLFNFYSQVLSVLITVLRWPNCGSVLTA